LWRRMRSQMVSPPAAAAPESISNQIYVRCLFHCSGDTTQSVTTLKSEGAVLSAAAQHQLVGPPAAAAPHTTGIKAQGSQQHHVLPRGLQSGLPAAGTWQRSSSTTQKVRAPAAGARGTAAAAACKIVSRDKD
jgi:hypothetical protein